MRSLDPSPLYRSTVGFDRLFSLLDGTGRFDQLHASGPPYNISKRGEDHYDLTLAVAGFRPEEISIVLEADRLTISGEKRTPEANSQFVHRGIAIRGFRRSFDLARTMKVAGASLENGLLSIHLLRESPEATKPRRIEVRSGEGDAGRPAGARQIEHAKAA